MPPQTRPPETDAAYVGRWLQIARLPNPSEAATPQGGEVTIDVAPGNSQALTVHYNPFLAWDHSVLDHAADDSWFISAEARSKRLCVFARTQPGPAQRDALAARVEALGFDATELEYPRQSLA